MPCGGHLAGHRACWSVRRVRAYSHSTNVVVSEPKTATITCPAGTPRSFTDVLSGETLDATESECTVHIPTGLFRIIDIEYQG